MSASHDVEATVDQKMADGVNANDADAALLAQMGYKQELKRNFSTLEVFGIAFSIMGLLPSIASTLAFSLPAGPGGMVWSWFLASSCIFVVGLAMADLGSAMPTSGGLYYWTHFYSSPKTRNYLSFLVGYSNSLGLIGGLCSIDYGFALMFCAVYVDCPVSFRPAGHAADPAGSSSHATVSGRRPTASCTPSSWPLSLRTASWPPP